MTPKNQELRDSLKQIETTITSALAHQPEDDAQCGQFLYDALVSVFNTADLAAHKYRSLASATPTPDGAAPSTIKRHADIKEMHRQLRLLHKALTRLNFGYDPLEKGENK